MYAIVQTGKKQFEVEKGGLYEFDKVVGTPGETYSFNEVLLVVDGETRHIGTPVVKGAEVTATIVKDVKGKKVISYKFKRRKGSRKKIGHRQQYTVMKIEDIKV